jgi:hypothetical protein
MARSVVYQGYTVRSAPRYDAEWGKWAINIIVSVEHPTGTKMRQFSGEVLYASEQEADVHGLAFGQRLIDGKVQGRSVADLKTADRRSAPRFPVQFPTIFTGPSRVEGTGIIRDLSRGGSRIESPVSPAAGQSLRLRIQVPGQDALVVDEGSVQWVSGQAFGFAFFRMASAERDRLSAVLATLHGGGTSLGL